MPDKLIRLWDKTKAWRSWSNPPYDLSCNTAFTVSPQFGIHWIWLSLNAYWIIILEQRGAECLQRELCEWRGSSMFTQQCWSLCIWAISVHCEWKIHHAMAETAHRLRYAPSSINHAAVVFRQIDTTRMPAGCDCDYRLDNQNSSQLQSWSKSVSFSSSFFWGGVKLLDFLQQNNAFLLVNVESCLQLKYSTKQTSAYV